MAVLKPLRAYRYNLSFDIGKLLSPPYDVVDEKKRNLYLRKKFNAMNIEYPYKSIDALKCFKKWLKENVIVREAFQSFYYLETSFFLNGKKYFRAGIIGAVEKKDVVRHEEVNESIVNERYIHFKKAGLFTSPVYLVSEDLPHNLKKYKLFEFDFENTSSKLYRISDFDSIKNIIDFFSDKKLFIADGHHRFAVAMKLKKPALAFIGKFSQSKILPTHRVVEALEFKRISSLLEVRKVKEDFGCINKNFDGFNIFAYNGKYFYRIHSRLKLKFPQEFFDVYNVKIKRYTKDIDIEKSEVIVLMNKISPGVLKENAGMIFPKKTTYFYPKVPAGMVFMSINE